jgi:very-short-patch-repair endonuclease
MSKKDKPCPDCGKIIYRSNQKCMACSQIGKYRRPLTPQEIQDRYVGENNPFYGRNHSQETKNSIGDANRGKQSFLGKKHSDASIKKMSNAKLGKKLSSETIRKMVLSRVGYKHSEETKLKIGLGNKGNHCNLGIKFTDEHKKHISLANIGKHKMSEDNKQKIIDAHLGKSHTIEARKKISEKSKGHAVPEGWAEVMRQRNKKNWSDPAYVKRLFESKCRFGNNKNEKRMSEILVNLGVKKRIDDIEHKYLADFYLPDFHCVIEADGVLFHAHPSMFKAEDIIPMTKWTAQERWDLDASRTNEMLVAGYQVLRFWENEFDRESVNDRIKNLRPIISCVVGGL